MSLAQDAFFGLVTVDAVAWSLMAVKLGFGHLFMDDSELPPSPVLKAAAVFAISLYIPTLFFPEVAQVLLWMDYFAFMNLAPVACSRMVLRLGAYEALDRCLFDLVMLACWVSCPVSLFYLLWLRHGLGKGGVAALSIITFYLLGILFFVMYNKQVKASAPSLPVYEADKKVPIRISARPRSASCPDLSKLAASLSESPSDAVSQKMPKSRVTLGAMAASATFRQDANQEVRLQVTDQE